MVGTVAFAVAAIVTVVRGIRRGDPSKKIRERACLFSVFALIFLRGLFPVHSWRVSGLYFAAALALAVTAVWKGPSSPNSSS
jgi:hypothetical protein